MTRDTVPPALLADVKNSLNITWSDDATDQDVAGKIANSAAYLDAKLGGPQDYSQDGMPRELLFERVRYARDSALDVFENNYQSLLIGAQNVGLGDTDGVESTVPAEN